MNPIHDMVEIILNQIYDGYDNYMETWLNSL